MHVYTHPHTHTQEYLDEGEEPDDELKDMFYLKRLDKGLFTLQLVDYIIAELCSSGVPQVRLCVCVSLCVCVCLPLSFSVLEILSMTY